MHSHKQHARRRARTAQLAAGVGLAATLALAVLPLHAALTGRADLAERVGPTETEPEQRPTVEPIDQQWVSRLLAAVGPAPVAASQTETNPVPPTPGTTTVQAEPEPTNPVPNARWQYLGSILTSRGRSAVLRDAQAANRQHLVFEGREIEGFKVTKITDSHVILSGSSGQTQVDLAPMGSSWSAPGAAAPVRTAAAAQQRSNPRVNPTVANRTRVGRSKSDLDPEITRQIREQLIQGNMDLERLAEMRKSGILDEATVEELATQFKEAQGLSDEELADFREKMSQ